MAVVAEAVESLGTKVEVRKDWKAVVGQMAHVGRAPEEVEAHPLEKLMGEKPRWQKSNPGKEGATIASQWRVNQEIKVRLPTQDTNTKASATTLGRIPVVDLLLYSPCSMTFEAQNSVTDVAETAVVSGEPVKNPPGEIE